MSCMMNRFVLGFVLMVTAAVVSCAMREAAAADDPPAGTTGHGWTLEEALDHLRRHPRDAYVQYVALQLARREGNVDEVADQLDRRPWRNRRRDEVELFSIFSGALAVQESLQLDAMREDAAGVEAADNSRPGRRARGRDGSRPTADQEILVSELTGPTIKSHPWEEMLAGRKPEVSPLSRSVPEDFYFVEFSSVNKLLEATERSDLWSTHLFSQAVQDAQTHEVERRVREQLAVEVSPLLRPFYDTVVEAIAITGSDPFVREGSDVTLMFHVRQPQVFRAQMDQFLVRAEQTHPQTQRSEGVYRGVQLVHLATPDRRIHVYSAYPAANLHVRTNSRVALERVLDAIEGTSADGRPVSRLGETAEFAFIRTLMPLGAPEEDGFIYLSDAFIRRLVGPTLRLTEQRRLVCYNHLKMIGHAGLMHLTERGRPAESLEELAAAGCTPGEFNAGSLVCPEGGTYNLADDGCTGTCSHHGHASFLVPCCEIETEKVTATEADAYKEFLEEYNSYWVNYFDPIAIRLQITPQRYRAETIVLPLIENSIYSSLAAVLGGEPEPLDALPVPPRNIFSVAVRLNKEALLQQSGLSELLSEPESEEPASDGELVEAVEALREIALALHFHHADTRQLPAVASLDPHGRPLLSWRVHLLPLLNQHELYEQFRLDEPWDSEHNKRLISRMPVIYTPADPQLAAAGKTRFVAPVGEATIFPPDGEAIAFHDITDGTSRTIIAVEVDDEHAVIWTRPDDLEFDAEKPRRGLAKYPPGAFVAAWADGSVQLVRETIDDAALAATFTRAGGEAVHIQPFLISPPSPHPPRRGFLFDEIPDEALRQLELVELLTKGIGNQVAFHVYDAEPLFDLNLARLMGEAMGAGGFDVEFLGFVPLIASLNSPVYLSVPVQDPNVVDRFLGRLESVLAGWGRQEFDDFLPVNHDFYRLDERPNQPTWSYAIRFGPVKWRFFWSRIGDAVYIASKREILEDISGLLGQESDETTRASSGHAMVRVRPQNWQRVLDHYQLGWGENNLQACQHNLGPLTSLGRALASGRRTALPTEEELVDFTARYHGARCYCPDGGSYALSEDGKSASCSMHGPVTAPRQPAAPSSGSELGRLMHDFADATIELAFLEDGLHAVVTIERKPD